MKIESEHKYLNNQSIFQNLIYEIIEKGKEVKLSKIEDIDKLHEEINESIIKIVGKL